MMYSLLCYSRVPGEFHTAIDVGADHTASLPRSPRCSGRHGNQPRLRHTSGTRRAPLHRRAHPHHEYRRDHHHAGHGAAHVDGGSEEAGRGGPYADTGAAGEHEDQRQ